MHDGLMICGAHFTITVHCNLLTSLIVASQTNIPEVMVAFDNQLFRGNRSKKISSNKIDAFKSPNMPNLGNFGYYDNEPTVVSNINDISNIKSW